MMSEYKHGDEPMMGITPDATSRQQNLLLQFQDSLDMMEACKEENSSFYLGLTYGTLSALRAAKLDKGTIDRLIGEAAEQYEARWPGLQERFGRPLTIV